MLKKLIPCALFCTVLAAFAADWPQFGGQNRDFTSSETGINKDWNAKAPALLWKVNMHDDGYAGPCVAGDTLFIIDRDGDNDLVKAFKFADGKELWSVSFPDAGKPNYGYCRSTPAYDGGKLYVLSRSGELRCLDAKSGKQAWSVNIIQKFGGKQPTWLHSLSPFIDGKLIIVCPGGASNPVALDKGTGAEVWRGDGASEGEKTSVSYATPVVATIGGVRQYLLFMAKALYGVDAGNGKQLWSFPWETKYDVNAALPVAVDGSRVFIASGYGHGSALVKVSGGKAEAVWTNRAAMSHFSSPIVYKGSIYANSDPDFLVCIDPVSGERRWTGKGLEKGGFCLVDETLICMGGKSGDVFMAKASPAAYTEMGRMTAPLSANGQNWTAPIVADKKLVVRTKLELGVFDLR